MARTRYPPKFAKDDLLDNRYRLLELVGEGGVGYVYKAYDETNGEIVAIKFLSRGALRDERQLHRFFREFRAVSRLDHPNCLRVFARGEQDGHHYFVMEYIAGEDLSHFKYREPREFLLVFLQLASALAYIHSFGIIHRDLKPSNILLIPGPIPQPKLMDFGLVKFEEASALAESARLTRTGEVIGTMAYMSPEQILGKKVDLRTDLYALGCMLYELWSEELPFERAQGPHELMCAHLMVKPPPLRTRVPHTPSALEDLALRLLAKEPEARPQSALEVLDVLKQLLVESGAEGLLSQLHHSLQQTQSASVLLEPPLVGRQEELTWLTQRMQEILAGSLSHSPLIAVFGENGIGKSDLTEECRASLVKKGCRTLKLLISQSGSASLIATLEKQVEELLAEADATGGSGIFSEVPKRALFDDTDEENRRAGWRTLPDAAPYSSGGPAPKPETDKQVSEAYKMSVSPPLSMRATLIEPTPASLLREAALRKAEAVAQAQAALHPEEASLPPQEAEAQASLPPEEAVLPPEEVEASLPPEEVVAQTPLPPEEVEVQSSLPPEEAVLPPEDEVTAQGPVPIFDENPFLQVGNTGDAGAFLLDDDEADWLGLSGETSEEDDLFFDVEELPEPPAPEREPKSLDHLLLEFPPLDDPSLSVRANDTLFSIDSLLFGGKRRPWPLDEASAEDETPPPAQGDPASRRESEEEQAHAFEDALSGEGIQTLQEGAEDAAAAGAEEDAEAAVPDGDTATSPGAGDTSTVADDAEASLPSESTETSESSVSSESTETSEASEASVSSASIEASEASEASVSSASIEASEASEASVSSASIEASEASVSSASIEASEASVSSASIEASEASESSGSDASESVDASDASGSRDAGADDESVERAVDVVSSEHGLGASEAPPEGSDATQLELRREPSLREALGLEALDEEEPAVQPRRKPVRAHQTAEFDRDALYRSVSRTMAFGSLQVKPPAVVEVHRGEESKVPDESGHPATVATSAFEDDPSSSATVAEFPSLSQIQALGAQATTEAEALSETTPAIRQSTTRAEGAAVGQSAATEVNAAIVIDAVSKAGEAAGQGLAAEGATIEAKAFSETGATTEAQALSETTPATRQSTTRAEGAAVGQSAATEVNAAIVINAVSKAGGGVGQSAATEVNAAIVIDAGATVEARAFSAQDAGEATLLDGGISPPKEEEPRLGIIGIPLRSGGAHQGRGGQTSIAVARPRTLVRRKPNTDGVPSYYQEQHNKISSSGRMNRALYLSRLLVRLCEYGPFVLFLEDLHEAEPGFFAFLGELLSQMAHEANFCVVGTVGPGSARRRLEALEPYIGQSSFLELKPLQRDGIQALIAHMLGSSVDDESARPLLERLASLLEQASMGQPLFIKIYLQKLIEDGTLRRSPQGWELSSSQPLEDQLLHTLDDLLRERLNQLSFRSLATLRMVAAVGRTFHFSTLRDVSQLEVEALIDILEEAMYARLLAPVSQDSQQADVYIFGSDKIVEQLDATNPPSQRRQLHHDIAQSLLRLKQVPHAEVARHLVLCGETDRAFLFFKQAGEKKLAAHDVEAAASLLQEAISCYDEASQAHPESVLRELQESLADALMALGQPGRANVFLRRLVQSTKDALEQAHYYRKWGNGLLLVGKTVEGVAMLYKALQCLGEKSTPGRFSSRRLSTWQGFSFSSWFSRAKVDPQKQQKRRLRAQIHRNLFEILSWIDGQQAREHLLASEELARRLEDSLPLAHAVCSRLFSMEVISDGSRAFETFETVSSMAGLGDDPLLSLRLHVGSLVYTHLFGQVPPNVHTPLARLPGSLWDKEPFRLSCSFVAMGWCHILASQWNQALERFSMALTLADEGNDARLRAFANFGNGAISLLTGRFAETVRITNQIEKIGQRLEIPLFCAIALELRGVSALLQGRYREAFSSFEQAIKILKQANLLEGWGQMLLYNHTEAMLWTIDTYGEEAIPDWFSRLRRNVKLARRLLLPHPLFEGFYYTLCGSLAARQRRDASAQKWFQKALGCEVFRRRQVLPAWPMLRLARELQSVREIDPSMVEKIMERAELLILEAKAETLTNWLKSFRTRLHDEAVRR